MAWNSGQWATAGGGALGAFGSYMAAQDQAEAYEAQASMKLEMGRESLHASWREADLSMKRGEKIKDSQVQAYASSGVSVGSGSPLLQMAATLADARDESNAILESGKYRQNIAKAEANAALKQASAAREAAVWGAVGSVLGTAGKVASLGS